MSDVETMTLSEFLLARIAEDEAPTWGLVPYVCEAGCCAPAGWVGHECSICGTREFGGTREAIEEIAREHDEQIHRRARVLAECEAKRRIVALHTPDHECTDGSDSYPGVFSGDDSMCERCPTLLTLALPYADHPDFREEWRA